MLYGTDRTPGPTGSGKDRPLNKQATFAHAISVGVLGLTVPPRGPRADQAEEAGCFERHTSAA